MAFLAHIGLAAFLLMSTVVGVRVLLVVRRTRQLADLTMGLGLLLNGAVGYALIALGLGLPSYPEWLAAPTLKAGIMTLSLGSGALWWFTWRVFRPDRIWSAMVFASAASLLAGSFVILTFGESFDRSSMEGVWYWVGFATRASAFAWFSIEAFLYYRSMRKRVRYGLAPRIRANAFLLWGTATACAYLMYGFTALGLILGRESLPAPFVLGQCLAGLVAAGAIYLPFFPPAWYRRLLRDPAEGVAGDAPA